MLNYLWFIAVTLFLVILGAVVFGLYSNLAKLKKEVEIAWSCIEGELERKSIITDALDAKNSSAKFGKLTKDLEESEYMVEEYQYYYNEMAYLYNTKIQTFPNSMVANYFGFKDAGYIRS